MMLPQHLIFLMSLFVSLLSLRVICFEESVQVIANDEHSIRV